MSPAAWASGTAATLPLGHSGVVVEDIKFAYNAYSLLRTSLYFGTRPPCVLSGLHDTTPSMDIARRGNRIMHMYCTVGGRSAWLGQTTLSAGRDRPRRVALTAKSADAVNLHQLRWPRCLPPPAEQGPRKGGVGLGEVELVLGMENGMSDEVLAACDDRVYIPQHGSVGSLSLNTALGVALHHRYGDATLDRLGAPRRDATVGRSDAQEDEGRLLPTPAGYDRTRPHDGALCGMTDEMVRTELERRRRRYPMQLALVFVNAIGDRNIGAAIRSANAFNAAHVVVVGRRKFNRRGAIGTDHFTPLSLVPDIASARRVLANYAWWSLEQDELLWDPHLVGACPEAQLRHAAVPFTPHTFCDDDAALAAACAKERREGYGGIAVVIPEEGLPVPRQVSACGAVEIRRTLSLVRRATDMRPAVADGSVNVSLPDWDHQHGLPGAISAAIVLDRLWTAVRAPPLPEFGRPPSLAKD